MNQATTTAIAGAITAAVLAGAQVLTHQKIDEVANTVVPKSEIEINQTRHDDEITAIGNRLDFLEQMHITDRFHDYTHPGEDP